MVRNVEGVADNATLNLLDEDEEVGLEDYMMIGILKEFCKIGKIGHQNLRETLRGYHGRIDRSQFY